jgi:hypothetical protein
VSKKLVPGTVVHAKDGSELRNVPTLELKEEQCPVTVAKEAYCGADIYVLVTTVIWMLPKLIVFLPLMLILSFIPCGIAKLYINTLPEPFDRVPRSWGFYFWFSVALFFSVPAIIGICVNLILDSIVYYIFSLVYCAVTCQWSQAMAGLERIRPFRGGPSIFFKMPDIFLCVMGQAMRQGFWEVIYITSMMWVLMPWLKYYINCNPWIYNLDHRLVQQISTSLGDCGTVDEVAEECRHVISRARQTRQRAHRLDLWSFVPHYPYPPADRRFALGMQAGGAAYPGKFTLLVHSTHADSKMGCSCVNTRGNKGYGKLSEMCPHSGSQEQFVLSNSIARPVYRVMLWYNNPFHFLTGWVEASISTGYPSQANKLHGGEHPMWLVGANTALTASRESFTGSGLIDWFFDYWLPVFVHEVRFAMNFRANKAEKNMQPEEAHKEALAYADSRYQQVRSSDGISHIKSKMGIDSYHNSTLADYRAQGEKENAEKYQAWDSEFASINETSCGLASQQCCLGRDLTESNNDAASCCEKEELALKGASPSENEKVDDKKDA